MTDEILFSSCLVYNISVTDWLAMALRGALPSVNFIAGSQVLKFFKLCEQIMHWWWWLYTFPNDSLPQDEADKQTEGVIHFWSVGHSNFIQTQRLRSMCELQSHSLEGHVD